MILLYRRRIQPAVGFGAPAARDWEGGRLFCRSPTLGNLTWFLDSGPDLDFDFDFDFGSGPGFDFCFDSGFFSRVTDSGL